MFPPSRPAVAAAPLRAPRKRVPAARRRARCTRRSTCAAGASSKRAATTDATTIHNYFDLDPRPGDRAGTRKQFGFADDDFVLFQPAARDRAQERSRRLAVRAAPAATRARPRRCATGSPARPKTATRRRSSASSSARRSRSRSGAPATAADAYAAATSSCSRRRGKASAIRSIEVDRVPAAVRRVPVSGARRDRRGRRARVLDASGPTRLVQFLAEPDDVRERYYDVNMHRARISFDLADSRPRSTRPSRSTAGSRGRRPDPVAHGARASPGSPALGKRVGYLALGIAIVAFFVGVATGFPAWTVTCRVAGLVARVRRAPVPIVLGYGVRAPTRPRGSRARRRQPTCSCPTTRAAIARWTLRIDSGAQCVSSRACAIGGSAPAISSSPRSDSAPGPSSPTGGAAPTTRTT